jgi:hypothetical protein
LRIEQRRVATLDFDEIMDQQHLHDPCYVDLIHRVLLQHQSKKRKMPGVFGCVFTARRIGNSVTTDDVLETIDLNQKHHLLAQAIFDTVQPSIRLHVCAPSVKRTPGHR